MKNITLCLLLLILTGFSGCIKVEDAAYKCGKKTPAPALNSTSFTATLGSVVNLSPTNYSKSIMYVVVSPNGNVRTTMGTNPIPVIATTAGAGLYKIVAQSNLNCRSDTAIFTINATNTLPDCGLAAGTLKETYSVYNAPLTTAAYTSGTGFSATWQINNEDFFIYFSKRPSKTEVEAFVVKYTDSYAGAGQGECNVKWDVNYDYLGYSGYVLTQYRNGQYNVVFCNMKMCDREDYPAASLYPKNVSGNLYYY